MKTRPIYNLQTRQQVGVAIYGKFSVSPVYIMLDALQSEFGGDVKRAFHEVKAMQKEKLLPRLGSEARPLTKWDFHLYRLNKKMGRRYWRWFQASGQRVKASTGYDTVSGYGYETPNGFVVVNRSFQPVHTVVLK